MTIVTSKYESNAGLVYKIRMDVAKVGITGNAVPAGAIDDPNVEVEVSEAGSRRKFGLHPRGVRGKRVGTGADLNKVFSVFIPVLTPGAIQTLVTAGTFTYKSQTYTDLTVVPET